VGSRRRGRRSKGVIRADDHVPGAGNGRMSAVSAIAALRRASGRLSPEKTKARFELR
jgi:hypothetical protein